MGVVGDFKVWSVKLWPNRKPPRYRRADELPTVPAWFYAPIINRSGLAVVGDPIGPFDTETEATQAAIAGENPKVQNG